MAIRICLNCVYVCCDPNEWVLCEIRGEPLVPRCANHPRWPGQLHDVPGTPCRNYQPKPPEPDESDDTVRRIPLSNGQFVLVDAADYEWLSRYHWHLTGGGYAARCENNKRILMHREIMQPPPGKFVDHINHQRGDNRRRNLRNCTCAENQQNQRRQICSKSRFKGVRYLRHSRRPYAKLVFRRQQVWLSFFDEEAAAARAYDYAAVRYFGPFAELNFPEEWPPPRRQEVYAEAQPLRHALAAKAARAQAEKKTGEHAKGKGARRQGKGKKGKGRSAKTRAKAAGRKTRGHPRQDAPRARKKSPRKGRPRKR